MTFHNPPDVAQLCSERTAKCREVENRPLRNAVQQWLDWRQLPVVRHLLRPAGHERHPPQHCA